MSIDSAISTILPALLSDTERSDQNGLLLALSSGSNLVMDRARRVAQDAGDLINELIGLDPESHAAIISLLEDQEITPALCRMMFDPSATPLLTSAKEDVNYATVDLSQYSIQFGIDQAIVIETTYPKIGVEQRDGVHTVLNRGHFGGDPWPMTLPQWPDEAPPAASKDIAGIISPAAALTAAA